VHLLWRLGTAQLDTCLKLELVPREGDRFEIWPATDDAILDVHPEIAEFADGGEGIFVTLLPVESADTEDPQWSRLATAQLDMIAKNILKLRRVDRGRDQYVRLVCRTPALLGPTPQIVSEKMDSVGVLPDRAIITVVLEAHEV
jgi:hypothetical protein